MNSRRIVAAVFLMFQASLSVCAQLEGSTEIASVIFVTTVPVLCGLYTVFAYIAGALASFVIVYAGIKWMGSQDDPGERKLAKGMITYTVVGLIIVLISSGLISLVISGSIYPCP